ncbi:MAG: AMP-binding protein, partial [Coriobacteriales bacterium]|nr:AMP-binding protein [Coriobacteriales bacterium]
MKLSFSTIGCPGYVWTDIYPMAKDLGFDGVEIRGIAGNEFAPTARPFLPRQRQRTITQLERIGLEISCFSTNCELCNEAGREQALDEVVQYIELASEMNTPYVRVLLSRDIRPQNFEDDEAVVETLRSLAGIASIYNVTILVETESDYADTARLARVLDAVGEPNVGALWDMHHPYRLFGETAEQTIANLGSYLRFCQVKDSLMVDGHVQYRMMGEGDMPLVEMFDALQASGFEGYVSFEWVRSWARDIAIGEPGIVFPQFMNYMRDYLRGNLLEQAPVKEAREEQVTAPVEAPLPGTPQTSLSGEGSYPWPKEHLIDLTFPQVLDHVCALYPDQYAFRFTEFDYTRTYPEFREDVNTFARSLIAMGVNPGDKVAIWATNVPAWFLTFWASVKVGAVLVTVNTGYKIHELEYLLRQSDTHTLVMVDEYKGTSYLDIVDELVPEMAEAGKPGAWHNDKLPFLKNVVTIDGPHPGCYSWDEALALNTRVKQAEVDRRCALIRKDDVCNMQYTSGTTGFPKGV